jgi:hypothetical protein
MSTNKTYTCNNCRTVYDELPDNGDGQFQCGACLNTDCFEEKVISDTTAILMSIFNMLEDMIKILDKIKERFQIILNQVDNLQAKLYPNHKLINKPE